MFKIEWQHQSEAFKIAGNKAYEVIFDDINDDLRIYNSVTHVIQDLWEREKWIDQGMYKLLQTEFVLKARVDSNGGTYLVVGECDVDDGYIDFDAFGYLDVNSVSVSETFALDRLLKNLTAFMATVPAPVLFDATVLLKENFNNNSLTMESVVVHLPTPHYSLNPLEQAFPEKLKKQVTPNIAMSKRGSIAIRTLQDTGHYRLALYDTQKVRRYIAKHVPNDDVFVELSLVPEPENDYDSEAIAIALPRSFGSSLETRKIGYLYIHERGQLLGGMLNELAHYSDGEFTCYGVVDRSEFGEQNIHVLLPHREVFEEELRELLASECLASIREKYALSSNRRVDVLRPEALKAITSFERSLDSGAIELSTGDIDSHGIRSVILIDSKTKQSIGSVYEGLLVLDDERRREQASSTLRKAGVNFSGPAHDYQVSVPDEFKISDELIPNINVRVYTRYVAFETNSKTQSGERLLLAEYNRATHQMWVQDEAIAPILCRYASRLGLKIANVMTPTTSWWLEEQVHFAKRRDYSGRYSDLADENMHREIMGLPRKRRESTFEFAVRDGYVHARNKLFPDHELSGAITLCRICGENASVFRVYFCAHDLSYCQECLERASTGASEPNKALVLEQVKELSELEFAGEPPLASQLQRINALGRRRVSPSEIDRMLALRSAFRASEWSWTQLLADGGLIDGGLRTARGTVIPAKDGHLCHSLYEKAVDDFFHHHGIYHETEPLYPRDSLLNPQERRRADWQLSDGTFVEMWGLISDPLYEQRMREKINLATRQNIPLIGIKPDEISNLATIFRDWIK